MKAAQLLSFLLLLNSQFAVAQIANLRHQPYNWKTDTARHAPGFSELTIAAAKDALLPLEFPPFITKNDPLYNFYEFEPAIVINFGGETRAYPLSILTLYELANDSIAGKQIMVTYCPRCNAALVYDRHIKSTGALLTFGISGLLVHNDMVMYDRETESWWEQLMGEAIAGEHSGASLRMLPALLISVKDYFDRYPHGKILSPSLMHAFQKKHGHRPYHHLEHGKTLSHKYYLPEKVDSRLPPLEHILDIHLTEHNRIYPFHALAKEQVVNETFDQTPIVVFYHGETVSVMDRDNLAKSKHVGSATAFNRSLDGVEYTFRKSGDYFTDDQTSSTWDITGYCRGGTLKGRQLELLPHSNHFAFAFLAFHPDAAIFGLPQTE